jgi:hypothetical protein
MDDRMEKTENPPAKRSPGSNGLTPSDQLVGIFLVNFVISLWVAIAFATWYKTHPQLPGWMYWVEIGILASSFGLATFDSWWPRTKDLSAGEKRSTVVNPNIYVLKVAVFALAGAYIFVLWRLAEETGGVISPFAPFLTAPALFAPFVTKNWKTIVALSAVVTLAIFLSHETSTLKLDSLWPYKGTAGVMVLLAGLLTALRMGVVKRGAPLTGEGSETEGTIIDADDDDEAGSPGLEGAGA